MASNSLSKSLSQFVTSVNESSVFDNPFMDDEIETSSVSMSKRNKKSSFDEDDDYKPKKSKPDKFTKIMSQGNEMIDRFMDEEFIDDFDGFIGNFLLDDEDVELRRNLLRYGRKYARETKVSGETSEINKAYSESEKLLSDLLDEINELSVMPYLNKSSLPL